MALFDYGSYFPDMFSSILVWYLEFQQCILRVRCKDYIRRDQQCLSGNMTFLPQSQLRLCPWMGSSSTLASQATLFTDYFFQELQNEKQYDTEPDSKCFCETITLDPEYG